MTLPVVCANPVRFSRSRSSGKERDAESGLDYFGARYYASSMGRFMSPDWSAKAEPVPYAKLEDPQSLNLYQYMLDNPFRGVDADGHCWFCDLVGALARSAVNAVAVPASVAFNAVAHLADPSIGNSHFKGFTPVNDNEADMMPATSKGIALAAGVLLPGVGGSAAVTTEAAAPVELEAAPQLTNLVGPSNLSPEEISSGLQGAPYQTQQVGINADTVNSYIDKINAGETLQPIKMDGDIIVDGNHRAAASVLTGTTPPTTPGTAPVGPPVRPLDQVNVTVWPKQ